MKLISIQGDPMRHLIISGLLLIVSAVPVYAQNFYFISQNTFQDRDAEAFEAYQETVSPIMVRHGGSYISLNLIEALIDESALNVNNFGDMGSPEQVGAFFSYPDFQNACPTLIGMLDDHVTYVVDKGFPRLDDLHSGDRVLMVTSSDACAMHALNHREDLNALGHWFVIIANRGLNAEVHEMEVPPVFWLYLVASDQTEFGHALDRLGTAYILEIQ
jgi:uncharacterized protein (DUF1330 family)